VSKVHRIKNDYYEDTLERILVDMHNNMVIDKNAAQVVVVFNTGDKSVVIREELRHGS
jgi:hypothetical protein